MSEKTALDLAMDAVEWTPVEDEPPEDQSEPYITHEGSLIDPVTGVRVTVLKMSDGRRQVDASEIHKLFGGSDDD